jgi:hypothetical protein
MLHSQKVHCRAEANIGADPVRVLASLTLALPYRRINVAYLRISGSLQGFEVMQQLLLDRRISGHAEGELAPEVENVLFDAKASGICAGSAG